MNVILGFIASTVAIFPTVPSAVPIVMGIVIFILGLAESGYLFYWMCKRAEYLSPE
jgi:uncharacterized protein YqgC (DUF456 family)